MKLIAKLLAPTRLVKSATLAAALSLLAPAAAQGQTAIPAADDAKQILKKMTDYIAAQKAIAGDYDSDIEVVTTEGQKISCASSGRFQIQRPDKLRATRTGGYADIEMVFDGKTLTILGKDLKSYAQIDAPGTVGQLVERIRDRTDAALPGADLFSATAYADLTQDLTSAKHIGRGVVGGVECEHLAFREADTDWQLWVETGPNPVPRKYVITSKTVKDAPQYTVQIRDWRTDAAASAGSFIFTPPPGATKVAAADLKQMGEVPAGVPVPGKEAGRN